MITARYVLGINGGDDREERYSARYVVGEHLTIMKNYLADDTNTIQCVSVRIIVFARNIKRLCIWEADAKPAYLQSDKHL